MMNHIVCHSTPLSLHFFGDAFRDVMDQSSTGIHVVADPAEIYCWGDGNNAQPIPIGDLTHLLAHEIDAGKTNSANTADKIGKDKFSGSTTYKAMVDLDSGRLLISADKKKNITSVSPAPPIKYVDYYASEPASNDLNIAGRYEEDFAESVNRYVNDKDNFVKNFPHRAVYMHDLLNAKTSIDPMLVSRDRNTLNEEYFGSHG